MGAPAEAAARVGIGQQGRGARSERALRAPRPGSSRRCSDPARGAPAWRSRAAATRSRTAAEASPGPPPISVGARLADGGEDVDAVGEGAAEPALIALDRERRAAALGVGLAAPAGARVGGRDQHEAAGQPLPGARPGDRDRAGLQRRPQRLERVAAELAELVEEEDAAMGERRLARARRVAAADQARRADRVVRRAERPAARPAGRRGRRRRWRSVATSSASSGASGGRIEGRRLAASDLPAPGGPTISRLWPPAAATSSA